VEADALIEAFWQRVVFPTQAIRERNGGGNIPPVANIQAVPPCASCDRAAQSLGAADIRRIYRVFPGVRHESQEKGRIAIELIRRRAALQCGRTTVEQKATHSGASAALGLDVVHGELREIYAPANVVSALDAVEIYHVVGRGIGAIVG